MKGIEFVEGLSDVEALFVTEAGFSDPVFRVATRRRTLEILE